MLFQHAPGKPMPLSISPCPITVAVAEVRFESLLPAEAVLGKAFAALSADFPNFTKLPVADFPSAIRDSDPNFEFLPLYKFEKAPLAVQLGPKSFGVLVEGEYPGWKAFGPVVVRAMHTFFGLGIATSMIRASLRYTNFFEVDIFNHLNASITLGDRALNSHETAVRTVISWEGFSHILQVNNTSIHHRRLDGQTKGTRGSVVDIDTLSLSLDRDFVRNYPTILGAMHLSEKSLFFALLKEQFVTEKLNPVYE